MIKTYGFDLHEKNLYKDKISADGKEEGKDLSPYTSDIPKILSNNFQVCWYCCKMILVIWSIGSLVQLLKPWKLKIATVKVTHSDRTRQPCDTLSMYLTFIFKTDDTSLLLSYQWKKQTKRNNCVYFKLLERTKMLISSIHILTSSIFWWNYVLIEDFWLTI